MLTIYDYLQQFKKNRTMENNKFEGFETFGSTTKSLNAHVKITTSYISFSNRALEIMGAKVGDSIIIKSRLGDDRKLKIMLIVIPSQRSNSTKLKAEPRIVRDKVICTTSFGKKKLVEEDDTEYYVTHYGNNGDDRWFELLPMSRVKAMETYKDVE